MLRAAVHTDLHARAASPRPVCDDDRTHCVTPFAYLASAPHRANNRTSSPHRHAARWRDDERVLTPIFEAVLNGSCTERADRAWRGGTPPGQDGRRGGAGLGVVGLYLAKRGCRVHAIEPLALQAAALRLAIERNALHLMRVHRAAIRRRRSRTPGSRTRSTRPAARTPRGSSTDPSTTTPAERHPRHRAALAHARERAHP